jgi:hypothetical protein
MMMIMMMVMMMMMKEKPTQCIFQSQPLRIQSINSHTVSAGSLWAP